MTSPGVVYLGGLEESGDLPGRETNRIELPTGRYSVVVHLVDWKADPGSVGEDGRPREGALPDFVVEVHVEAEPGKVYIEPGLSPLSGPEVVRVEWRESWRSRSTESRTSATSTRCAG